MSLQAQFFGRKSIGVHQGIMLFNESALNNKTNANRKASWVTEVDRNAYISKYASFNYGLGLGNYKNPDKRFEPYQSSNFFRVKFALQIHFPNIGDCKDCENVRRVNPYFIIGYNFDLLSSNFKAIGNNRVNANLKIGGGLVVKLNNNLGLQYGLTLNQRINEDYRTFFQHNVGLIVRLMPDEGNP